MNYRIVIPAACLVILAGCGGASDSAAPAAAPPAASSAPATASKTTVAAVREGSGNAAIRVRFLIEKPPVVGQELQVQVDFSSFISEPITLDVAFEGDKIQLLPEAATASIALPRSGEDVRHTLILTPQAAGLSELKVHAKIVGDPGGAEALYVIPILADTTGQSDKTGPAGKADNANP